MMTPVREQNELRGFKKSIVEKKERKGG